MSDTVTVYTPRERLWLAVVAVVGALGLNGIFAWALWARPDALFAALANPVAAAFIAEAFLMVGVLAYLLGRWRVSRVHWAWFVVLSLAGGVAFALPAVLLWSTRRPAGAR